MRSNNFDALRLIAAMLVLVDHQFALMKLHEPRAIGNATWATIGLAMFFSISGYLIAKSWDRDPHVWRFAARRVLRLWPLVVLVTVTLSALVLHTRTSASDHYHAVIFLGNVFLSGDDWFAFPMNPIKSLHGPWWTISHEIGCYVALVISALLLGRLQKWAVLVVSLVGIPAFLYMLGGRQAMEGIAAQPYMNFLGFLAFFAVGASLHYWPHAPAARIAAMIVGISAALLGETALGLILMVPVLCEFVGMRSWPVLRSAGRYGDLSYGIYLWAWPVQQWWVLYFDGEAPFLTVLFCAIVSTVALAFVSWHIVEKQALRLKPAARTEALPPSEVARAT